MPSRNASAIRLLALCLGLAWAAVALAVTPEESLKRGQETLGRLFAILTQSNIPIQPADRAALERDRGELQQALKSKGAARIDAVVARATADLDRLTSGNLQTNLERYKATLAPLKALGAPVVRELVRNGWPRIEKLLADESRVLAYKDSNAVAAATKALEAARAAVAPELRASLESLRSSAARLLKGNERLLAERARGFRPACDAIDRALKSQDLVEMAKAAGGLVPLIPDAKARVEEALTAARGKWSAAEGEARALLDRLPDDLPYTDDGPRIKDLLRTGGAAAAAGEADALREAAEALGALLQKAPGDVSAKKSALLASRDTKAKGAQDLLGPGRGALKTGTASTLEKALAEVQGLAPAASLKALTSSLKSFDAALGAARAESSAAFDHAAQAGRKVRACVADLETSLKDLLSGEARATLDQCLAEMQGQEEAGSAGGLEQAARDCQARCEQAGRDVCHGLDEEVQLASRLAARDDLDGPLRSSLANAIGALRPALQPGDCRGIDRARLGEVRRAKARAQITLSLKDAYAAFYEGQDGLEKAIHSLQDLPRDQQEKSPLYLWSLAYFYYLKHQTLAGTESARWLSEARATFKRAGATARADLASSGLFPDDFVTAMAAPGTDGS